MIKIAILGLGDRGASVYGNYLSTRKDVQIHAICDIDEKKLQKYQEKYGVLKENCYSDVDDFFAAGKLADILVIATLDQQHYKQAMQALDLNYHLLLEKPISNDLKECVEIEKKAKEKHLEVIVCHVLRYTTFYRKIKEIVDNHLLGDIVHIHSTENVGYYHQAHSFVRGNWNCKEKTSPMILQKCCHDMDILNWLIDKKVVNVSSYGSLSLFKKENAPIGSAAYCVDCQVKDQCPYNAVRYYVENAPEENIGWPYDIVVMNPTKEKLLHAIQKGPYGRCVYHCDNDVVDHQVVNILYENEVTASHTMCAFSKECYRQIQIYGTRGDLIADTLSNTITYHSFLDNQPIVIDVNKIATDLSGHMGGDHMMIDEFIKMIRQEKSNLDSSIEKSVLSHVVCLAAEASRLEKGKNINIEEFKKSVL